MRLGIPVVVVYVHHQPAEDDTWSGGVYGSLQSFADVYTANVGDYVRHGLGLDVLWFVALVLVFAIGYALLRRLLEMRTPCGAHTRHSSPRCPTAEQPGDCGFCPRPGAGHVCH